MKKVLISLLMVGLFSTVAFGALLSVVPNQISIQGRLIADGEPVVGSKSVTFKIYKEGETTPIHNQTISVTADENGIFNAVLTNLDDPFDEQYSLTISFDSTILGPEPLYSSPYAITAKNLFGGEVVAASESTGAGAAAVKGFGGSDAVGGLFFSKSSQLPALGALNDSGGIAAAFKNNSNTNPALVVENVLQLEPAPLNKVPTAGNEEPGMIFFHSTLKKPFVYVDGTRKWVSMIRDDDEILELKARSSHPTGTIKTGSLYYNDLTDELYVYTLALGWKALKFK